MPFVDDLPISKVKTFLDCSTAEPGILLQLGQHGKAIGMRSVFNPVAGQRNPGFIAFEGHDKCIFVNDVDLGRCPAIDASDLAYVSVKNITPQQARANNLNVGDVCLLAGYDQLCLAISHPGRPEHVGGYLILDGDRKGEIVTGYNPQVRLGQVVVNLVV